MFCIFEQDQVTVYGMDSKATHSITLLKFVCPRISHLITIIPGSQLHFLANKNSELPVGNQ